MVKTLDKEKARELAIELGLTEEEYNKVVEIQERQPSVTELYIYSLMWSEHCSYKHSKNELKKLPSEGEYVLQGPGENAGVISVGDGWALAFKMESHNHPSALNPYEGAATGVGGVMRDIFAMGARPVAALNSLRFGKLSAEHQRDLFTGAIEGIADYGNTLEVPTIGGEVSFMESFAGNCLVGAMGLGLLREEDLIKAVASGTGNHLVIMGRKTGKEGIGGASTLASQEFGDDFVGEVPVTQEGDPKVEKALIEVCLTLLDQGKLVALGDLGAAGITSSASEMASSGHVGVEIDVQKVHTTEPNMEPFEVMVSETQERMLAVVTPENLSDVEKVCAEHEIEASVIGSVTDTDMFVVCDGDEVVAEIPAQKLADDAPRYSPEAEKPDYIDRLTAFDPLDMALDDPQYMTAEFKLMLQSPNLSSRNWIYNQFKYDARGATVLPPGGDAAVVQVGLKEKGELSKRGIAVTADCNSRYCYLDPRRGTQIAFAEAMRNISCVGAKPAALTDCLCFGSPENPGVFWTFKESVEGLAEASKKASVPVISGNVSFYNETNGNAVYPTPMIGMVGLIDDVDKAVTLDFKNEGDCIIMLGETKDELGASEYANYRLGVGMDCGEVPSLDLDEEIALCDLLQELADKELLESAHDVSEGGASIAVAESAIAGKIGCEVVFDYDYDVRTIFFGESQSRAIISVKPDNYSDIIDIIEKFNVPFSNIGTVGGSDIKINDNCSLPIDEAVSLYMNALEENTRGEGVAVFTE